MGILLIIYPWAPLPTHGKIQVLDFWPPKTRLFTNKKTSKDVGTLGGHGIRTPLSLTRLPDSARPQWPTTDEFRGGGGGGGGVSPLVLSYKLRHLEMMLPARNYIIYKHACFFVRRIFFELTCSSVLSCCFFPWLSICWLPCPEFIQF